MLRVYNLIPNSCLMSDRIKPPAVLAIATAIYILLFGAIGVWRYGNFSYNAMDLAILNQVFYNSAHGDLFASSVHPPTYLADHLELVADGDKLVLDLVRFLVEGLLYLPQSKPEHSNLPPPPFRRGSATPMR